jgi:chaperonin GroEL (HSP60 family)
MANRQDQLAGQPILVLPEGTLRPWKDAQHNNIAAAKAVADAVRTTLGPKGMDKMLVDNMGDIVITNDGVTILEEMQIEHPAAKMLVEVSKTQNEEVGDGTTTAAVLAGEFLKKAESLLDQNIHPTVITKGYKIAAEKALKILNGISESIKPDDSNTLVKIAMTSERQERRAGIGAPGEAVGRGGQDSDGELGRKDIHRRRQRQAREKAGRVR